MAGNATVGLRASVIVPTRDRAAVLRDCLASLTRQRLPADHFEVIVVDNGSRDDTAAVARGFDGPLRLRVLREDEPGLHVGRHAGARAARSDVLMFCDDDIVADPGWIEAVSGAFEADPHLALVGGNNRPGWERPPPAWLAFGWSLPRGPVPGGRALPALSILDFGAGSFDLDPGWVWGCNFNVRRAALDAAGGFHPDALPADRLRLRGDGEMHVGQTVRARGWRCRFVGEGSVTHRVDATRMTADYFARRARMQGISDAYTAIRRDGGVRPDGDRWRRSAGDALHDLRDRLQGWRAAPDDPVMQWRAVQAGVRRAWREGWQAHRAEAARDPALLSWILQADYRDAPLPSAEQGLPA